jgi:hypothetical protein
MTHATKRRPAPVKLAIEVEPKFRKCVVGSAYARQRQKRSPTELQIRQLRFIWMRDLTEDDLAALNWLHTGPLFCRRWIYVSVTRHLKLTHEGRRHVGVHLHRIK